VDASPPFTASEANLLRALVEEGVDFLIVGLAAAALQGAPAVTQDIDLWFGDPSAESFHRALRRVGVSYVSPGLNSPPLLVGEGAELFAVVLHMHGLGTFEQEKRRAFHIEVGGIRVPVLPLERIIASKRATGRPKDLAILPALEDTLRVLRSKQHPRGRRRGK
jgi:predicted nucleotidyltransferase